MTVFKGMPRKRVGVQPYNIDGNVLYTIKCKKNQWHTKQLDGHYWATTTSKNKQESHEVYGKADNILLFVIFK